MIARGIPDIEKDGAAFGEKHSLVFDIGGETMGESIDCNGTPA